MSDYTGACTGGLLHTCYVMNIYSSLPHATTPHKEYAEQPPAHPRKYIISLYICQGYWCDLITIIICQDMLSYRGGSGAILALKLFDINIT